MTILNLLPRLAAFQPHTFTGGTTLCLNVIPDLVESIFDAVTSSLAFFPSVYPLLMAKKCEEIITITFLPPLS